MTAPPVTFRPARALDDELSERATDTLSAGQVVKRDLSRYYRLVRAVETEPLREHERRIILEALEDGTPPERLPWWLQRPYPGLAERLAALSALELVALADEVERSS